MFRDLRAGRQTFGQVGVARAWLAGQPGCDGDACTQIDLIGAASIVIALQPTAARNGGYTRTWSVWILTLRSSRGVFAAVRPASPHGVAALGILEAWKLACVRVEAGSSRRMCTTWPAGRPRGTRDAPGGGRRHIDASIDKAGRRLPRLARAGKDEQSHEPRPGGLTLRLPEGRRAARPGCPRGRGRAARPRRCAARQGRRAGRTGAPWQRRS